MASTGCPSPIAALGFRGAIGKSPALRARFRRFEIAGAGILVMIGVPLATGQRVGCSASPRGWAGSVNLPP